MADVKIRNLDDRLTETYRRMAERAGISLEEQLRRALADYASAGREALVQRLRAGLEDTRAKYGVMEESWRFTREDRDRRG